MDPHHHGPSRDHRRRRGEVEPGEGVGVDGGHPRAVADDEPGEAGTAGDPEQPVGPVVGAAGQHHVLLDQAPLLHQLGEGALGRGGQDPVHLALELLEQRHQAAIGAARAAPAWRRTGSPAARPRRPPRVPSRSRDGVRVCLARADITVGRMPGPGRSHRGGDGGHRRPPAVPRLGRRRAGRSPPARRKRPPRRAPRAPVGAAPSSTAPSVSAAPSTSAPPLEAPPPGEVDRVLSGDVSLPEGFVVPAGETWMFDPDAVDHGRGGSQRHRRGPAGDAAVVSEASCTYSGSSASTSRRWSGAGWSR